VAIEGDPGVGKTSLARRCLAEAAGLRVLQARASLPEADLDFGRRRPEIAAELFISRKAVEYHLGDVYAKCGLRGTAGASALRRAIAPASSRVTGSSRAPRTGQRA
jgi:hypothetical protein